jgi:hypothetical protein
MIRDSSPFLSAVEGQISIETIRARSDDIGVDNSALLLY